MSDEKQVQATHSADTKPPAPPADWFLMSLVAAANTTGLEVPVTLHVGGLLVTGTVASGATYFKETAALVERAGNSEFTKSIAEAIESNAGIYTDPDEGDDLNTPTFIHLKGARFHDASGNRFPPTGVWWRGRLSEVSGFHLGSYS